MSVGRIVSVIDAEDRAGVQPLLEAEGRGAGHLVAGHHGVLHGGGAAPRGQQREVQVDPAGGGTARAAGARGAPYATTGQASGASSRAGPGSSGSLGRSGVSISSPALLRAHRAPGDGTSSRPRPARASGRVSTATTSWREASRASRAGHGDLGGAGEDEPHRATEPLPKVACGAEPHGRGARSRPTRRRGWPSWPACAGPVHAVDEQDAVEVVGLVLDAAGQQLGALEVTGSPCLLKPLATTRSARVVS